MSDELEDLLLPDIQLNAEAIAQLAMKPELLQRENEGGAKGDAAEGFYSEHEGGRLRTTELTVDHIEKLVRSWNGTDKKMAKATEGATTGVASDDVKGNMAPQRSVP